jgi:hypothetical protein
MRPFLIYRVRKCVPYFVFTAVLKLVLINLYFKLFVCIFALEKHILLNPLNFFTMT